MKKFLAGFLMGDCAPLNLFLRPVVLLGFRLYIAKVFFMSGMSKINNWEMTLGLFQDDYKVPLLPSDLAATLATSAELLFPVLLVIGLLTRPAALGLFVLNGVAAYVLANSDFASLVGHWQHVLWAVMIGVIFTFGPGALSIDKLLSNKWKNS